MSPLIIYKNADLDKIKILKDNRKKIGIYRWINKINGNTYVGSSINITVRMYSYFSIGSLRNKKTYINRSLLKYGFSNFELQILEYCTKENLLSREQYYIDKMLPEYNIAKVAGNILGYKHTIETKEKMRNKILSVNALNKKYIAISKATEANRISIKVENIKTNVIKNFISIRQASRELNISSAALSYALRKKSIYKQTYKITKSIN